MYTYNAPIILSEFYRMIVHKLHSLPDRLCQAVQNIPSGLSDRITGWQICAKYPNAACYSLAARCCCRWQGFGDEYHALLRHADATRAQVYPDNASHASKAPEAPPKLAFGKRCPEKRERERETEREKWGNSDSISAPGHIRQLTNFAKASTRASGDAYRDSRISLSDISTARRIDPSVCTYSRFAIAKQSWCARWDTINRKQSKQTRESRGRMKVWGTKREKQLLHGPWYAQRRRDTTNRKQSV